MKNWMIALLGVTSGAIAWLMLDKKRYAKRSNQMQRNRRKLKPLPGSKNIANEKLRYIEKLKVTAKEEPTFVKGKSRRNDSFFNNI